MPSRLRHKCCSPKLVCKGALAVSPSVLKSLYATRLAEAYVAAEQLSILCLFISRLMSQRYWSGVSSGFYLCKAVGRNLYPLYLSLLRKLQKSKATFYRAFSLVFLFKFHPLLGIDSWPLRRRIKREHIHMVTGKKFVFTWYCSIIVRALHVAFSAESKHGYPYVVKRNHPPGRNALAPLLAFR